MGCGQKRFKLVWRCHKLLSGFLSKGHLPSVTSVTSIANDRVKIKFCLLSIEQWAAAKKDLN